MDLQTLRLSANEMTHAVLLLCDKLKIFAWRNNTMGVRTQDGGYRPVGGIHGGQGSPDVIGVLPNGKFLGIEIKTNKDRMSIAQSEVQQRITENNGLYIVVNPRTIALLPSLLMEHL